VTESDRPNLITLRVKMLDDKPLTLAPAEMAALYELLLAADGTAGDSEAEGLQALNWRALHAAVVANFDTSIPSRQS
jgi:hypothetical protein